MTLMSPAKTFNTPGLSCGVAVISNPDLRRRFHRAAQGSFRIRIRSVTRLPAAYTGGESWRLELLRYLRGNRDCPADISGGTPAHVLDVRVEATYLAWLDTRLARRPEQ